jgi:hypothetical protein
MEEPMKKRVSLLLTLLTLLSLPFSALAMNHGNSGHDHGDKKKMDHGSHGASDMAGHENMIMIGDATVDGVKAMAHLNDVGAEMKKAGMDATHHLMIAFADAGTGKQITEGSVAAKVTGPDGKTAAPIRLVGMEGHFGADIALKQKGEYRFEIGSKLPDEKKRTFEFRHTLK